ncbi:hypothetical protein HK096_004458 [Nowakowskiella sp. JEL0078]|nr:hypothetical protein HK096_004458 [Nowakowskiella sp. JEL0078]
MKPFAVHCLLLFLLLLRNARSASGPQMAAANVENGLDSDDFDDSEEPQEFIPQFIREKMELQKKLLNTPVKIDFGARKPPKFVMPGDSRKQKMKFVRSSTTSTSFSMSPTPSVNKLENEEVDDGNWIEIPDKFMFFENSFKQKLNPYVTNNTKQLWQYLFPERKKIKEIPAYHFVGQSMTVKIDILPKRPKSCSKRLTLQPPNPAWLALSHTMNLFHVSQSYMQSIESIILPKNVPLNVKYMSWRTDSLIGLQNLKKNVKILKKLRDEWMQRGDDERNLAEFCLRSELGDIFEDIVKSSLMISIFAFRLHIEYPIGTSTPISPSDLAYKQRMKRRKGLDFSLEFESNSMDDDMIRKSPDGSCVIRKTNHPVPIFSRFLRLLVSREVEDLQDFYIYHTDAIPKPDIFNNSATTNSLVDAWIADVAELEMNIMENINRLDKMMENFLRESRYEGRNWIRVKDILIKGGNVTGLGEKYFVKRKCKASTKKIVKIDKKLCKNFDKSTRFKKNLMEKEIIDLDPWKLFNLHMEESRFYDCDGTTVTLYNPKVNSIPYVYDEEKNLQSRFRKYVSAVESAKTFNFTHMRTILGFSLPLSEYETLQTEPEPEIDYFCSEIIQPKRISYEIEELEQKSCVNRELEFLQMDAIIESEIVIRAFKDILKPTFKELLFPYFDYRNIHAARPLTEVEENTIQQLYGNWNLLDEGLLNAFWETFMARKPSRHPEVLLADDIINAYHRITASPTFFGRGSMGLPVFQQPEQPKPKQKKRKRINGNIKWPKPMFLKQKSEAQKEKDKLDSTEYLSRMKSWMHKKLPFGVAKTKLWDIEMEKLHELIGYDAKKFVNSFAGDESSRQSIKKLLVVHRKKEDAMEYGRFDSE